MKAMEIAPDPTTPKPKIKIVGNNINNNIIDKIKSMECAEEVYRNLKENPDAEDVMWAIRDSLILFGTSKRS